MIHLTIFLKKIIRIIAFLFFALSPLQKNYGNQESLYQPTDKALIKKNLTSLKQPRENRINIKILIHIPEKKLKNTVINTSSRDHMTFRLNPIKKILIEFNKETLQDVVLNKNKANLFSSIIIGPSNC